MAPRRVPLAAENPGRQVASGFLYGLGFLAVAGLWAWLGRRNTGPRMGFIVAASGQAQAGPASVSLDISVLSEYPDSRLFEVAWAMAHPAWTRAGDTLLREVPPGATERFGVLELTPPFGAGDAIQVALVLFSRPIDGGNPVEEDRRDFSLTAV